jgi:hypothetical protein
MSVNDRSAMASVVRPEPGYATALSRDDLARVFRPVLVD